MEDEKSMVNNVEYFGKSARKTTISDDKLTITHSDDDDRTTTYGYTVIDSIQPSIYRWIFEIKKCCGAVSIGIDDAQCKGINNSFYLQKDTENYSYQGSSCKWRQHKSPKVGAGYATGDIVCMTLDLWSDKLSFSVNNNEQTVFEKVTKHNQLKYRMAVALHRNDIVTLINYNSGKNYIELLQNKEKKIVELKQEKIQIYSSISNICNGNTYESWNSYDVLVWILSLDNNRFLKKYENILKKNLIAQNVKGVHLKQVNEMDILGWGIKDFEHKKFLITMIQKLIDSEGGNT
eukprot:303457_1